MKKVMGAILASILFASFSSSEAASLDLFEIKAIQYSDVNVGRFETTSSFGDFDLVLTTNFDLVLTTNGENNFVGGFNPNLGLNIPQNKIVQIFITASVIDRCDNIGDVTKEKDSNSSENLIFCRPVPEPATLFLLASGGLMLMICRKQK